MQAHSDDHSSWLVKGTTGLILVVLVGAFFVKIIDYVRGADPVKDPRVIPLTQENAAIGIRFGQSPVCNNVPCWVKEQWSDLKEFQANVPQANISRLPNYQTGIDSESMYYQILIPVTPRLQNKLANEPVSFTPVRLYHYSYRIYLNGRVVLRKNRDQRAPMPLIKVALSDVRDGVLNIVVHSDLHPTDPGIFHRGAMLLGHEQPLRKLLQADSANNQAYHTITAMVKGGILVVFALLLLFSQTAPMLKLFLLFGLASLVQDIVRSHVFAAETFREMNVFLVFSSKVVAGFALMAYVLKMRGTPFRTARLVGWAALGVGVVLLWTIANMLEPKRYMLPTLANLVQFYFMGTMLATAVLVARTWIRERQSFDLFVGVFAAYLGLTLWMHFFPIPVPFIQSAYIELILFLYMALHVAREYARRERLISEQYAKITSLKVDEAIAQTTKMIAHDSRRPIQQVHQIVGRLVATKDPAELQRLARVHLPRTQELLAAVEQMTDEILFVSAPQRVAGTRATSVRQCVAAVCDRVEAGMAAAKIGFSIELDHERQVVGDRASLERALNNIVDNAANATGANGQVLIKTSDAERAGKHGVEIRIENRGPVLVDYESLFAMFFTTDKVNGTGLGLPIVRKVMEEMQGSVHGEAMAGYGSAFVLWLPAADDIDHEISNTIAEAEPPTQTESTRNVVVVIDDDIFVREHWQSVSDANVRGFANHDEFWQQLNLEPELEQGLLCVVTDYYIDGSDTTGLDFARSWQQQSAIPVIISTSTPEFSLQDAATQSWLVIDKTPRSLAQLHPLLAGYSA